MARLTQNISNDMELKRIYTHLEQRIPLGHIKHRDQTKRSHRGLPVTLVLLMFLLLGILVGIIYSIILGIKNSY